jgi:SAM-dependent methyltransferase
VRSEARLWRPVYTAVRRAAGCAPAARRWLPDAPVRAVRDFLAERALRAWPDRRYLEDQILPRVAASRFSRVLFVGCRRYTRSYGRCFDGTPTEYWTADYDPRASRFGEPGRHLICDIRAIASRVPCGSFDAVILNGVFGFGVDDAAAMEETVAAIHAILTPGGRLLVGWNQGLTPDPAELPAMRRLFRRQAMEPLPAHESFPEPYRHVYDFFAAA